ncbi:MAG: CoA synthetase [Rhizobiales bacterium NRL2]|jgi:glutaconate CoA-transferase subunit A|nr:MAG: CoA synthetase [Rhizobiales bacterium NRL2]
MADAIRSSAEELAAMVPDGAQIAVPPDYSGVAMELTRALVRRGVKNLHLVCVPVTGLQGDMLIGAGAVSTIETSAVTLGEFGGAPRFQAALKAGTLKVKDATCPAVHAAIQAGQKGIPYMPLRGMIGSDILANRDDWLVQQNPFSADEDPIVLLPALRPDFAIFHGLKADRQGNVYLGIRRELFAMAGAARQSLVTVEEIVEGNLLEDDATAAGTLSSIYVGGVAEARHGAWPLPFWNEYATDDAHMQGYVAGARSEEGFADYLRAHVLGESAQAAAE